MTDVNKQLEEKIKKINAQFFADIFNNYNLVVEASVIDDEKERLEIGDPIIKAFEQNTKSIKDLIASEKVNAKIAGIGAAIHTLAFEDMPLSDGQFKSLKNYQEQLSVIKTIKENE